MKADEKTLEIISNETKKTIYDLNIVTPSIYTTIFSKLAALHNTDISEEKNITDTVLDEKIIFFTNMQNQASKNAQKLSENTDKAICAIQDKDENILKEVLEETQELKQEIKKLKESIYRDELTNIFNRKWLHDNVLDEEAQGFKGSGTLAIVDLNYFKSINDTYGHTIGDKVLVFIATQLQKTQESVIRYGGDEFIVMFCHGTTAKIALEKLNDIREDILRKHIMVKDASFKVSFSFGVEEFKEGDRLNDIIEKADQKMYNDKLKIKKRISTINMD